MRVLYVESAYGFGGSLTGLLHLFQHLPAEVEPVLVTAFDPAPFVEMPADLIHRQVDVTPLKEREQQHWLAGAWRYFRQHVRPWEQALAPLVREYQPDVIHANNSYTINRAVAQLGRKYKIPTISHQKDFEYDGRLTRLLARRSGFSHHLGTSGAVTEHLIDRGVPAERCSTIYEPVIGPTDEQLGPPLNERSGPPVVAMHSMVVPWKGQHVFLDAVAELRQRGLTDFRPVIAGSAPAGEAPYMERLRKQCAELGLEGWVEFPGYRRDVYEFLAGVDVAVHSAVNPEPFGRVAAEAMLAGLPTIVTSDGGPAEYVDDERTGLIVPRNDSMAMADALERLLADVQLRQQLGAAAREYAVEAFDPDRLARELTEIYHSVIAGEPVAVS